MFNAVEYVREICKEKGIAISQLEQECGFSNGYLNPKKLKKIPYDRAVLIAERLGLSVNYLVAGEEQKSPPFSVGDELSEEEIQFIKWYRTQASEKEKALLRTLAGGDATIKNTGTYRVN